MEEKGSGHSDPFSLFAFCLCIQYTEYKFVYSKISKVFSKIGLALFIMRAGKKKAISICLTLFILLTLLEKARAQVTVPEKSLPDQQQERLFKEPPEKKVPEPPEAEIEERILPKAPPSPETAVKFPITKIIVEGSTVFTQEELGKITAPYENKELSFQDLNEVAGKITKLYRNAGYIISRAYIPPQKVEKGVITIKVFEGKVGQINIEGNRYFKSTLISRGFQRLKGKVLNSNELRKALLYLNRNPDLEVKAILEPGKIPETTDILLTVKDRFPHHVGYEINNLGGRLTKHTRHISSYTSTNFLGFNDSLSLQFPWAESGKVKSVSVNYIFPLNDLGTEVGININSVSVRMGKELQPFDIKSASNSYSTYIQFPLWETNRSSSNGRIGFEIINSATKILGEKTMVNELRVLNLGLTYNKQDLRGRTNMYGKMDIGFPDFLGASGKKDPLSSPSGSGGKFTRYKLGITRLQVLPHSSYIILNCQSQLSPDKLSSSKRYFIGGAYTVRGYPEYDAAGDYGMNASAELITPSFIIPSRIKFKGRKLKDVLRFAFFTDLGLTFNHNTGGNSFLAGSGLGLRLTIGRYVSGRVDVAWPIGDEPSENDNLQVHFSLTLNY